MVITGIICDGFHLPASAVKIFTRTKGLERLILTSDVALAGGLNPGICQWGSMEVEVFKDGHLGLAGTGGILAGDRSSFRLGYCSFYQVYGK